MAELDTVSDVLDSQTTMYVVQQGGEGEGAGAGGWRQVAPGEEGELRYDV
jgi:hypothetical protein